MFAEQFNTRVLVIDDEELVRDNIEEILAPKKVKHNAALVEAAGILFEEEEPTLLSSDDHRANFPEFTVDKAINGQEGYRMIEQAVRADRPYSVIFLDMRMPGWDGLETAIHIREVDKKAEIIIVTAYSDHSIKEVISKAGRNVGYHVKPYASEEILQLATKAVTDYNKLRNLESLISVVGNIHIQENHLQNLFQNIVDQLAQYINTDTAILGKVNDDHTYEELASVGPVQNRIQLSALLDKVEAVDPPEQEVIQIDDVIFAKMSDYSLFAVLKNHESLKTEKVYLLKLFVTNAARAIQNAELKEALLKKEKLSAVGNAVGMLMHDLRTPIKTITLIADLLREQDVEEDLIFMLDECGKQASEIFDDFLDFLRETPIEKKQLDLRQVIDQAINLAENRARLEPVKVEKQLSGELHLYGDQSKLKRSLMNLISNAADAMKLHQTVDPCITINAQTTLNEVMITVRDNGPGIPESILPTLFEPFVTKNKSGGTGLGLAIVKQYIKGHQGSIVVANDRGAVFTIKLPTTL